ncbi:hypothetical protein [Flaviaesturariibacter amylovorans]|uniref:Lipoprotein n=1 Tax=Flaviaesturariibacter amylovorans TaxID=1084520 RepID=A0ABP8H2J1_9BACT
MRVPVLFLLLLSGLTSQASCFSGMIYAWDRSRRVPPDGLLRMVFYGTAEELLPRLRKAPALYLRSEHDSVSVSVHEVLKGEFRESMVALRPAKLLHAGAHYRLVLDALWQGAPDPLMERAVYGNEGTTFLVEEAGNRWTLELSGCPAFVKHSYVSYGCGPEQYAWFRVPAARAAGTAVRVQVSSPGSGAVNEYVVAFQEGYVGIGHAMCSGAFRFGSGRNYTVRFALVDRTGRQGSWSDPVAFRRPEPPDERELR